MCSGHSIFSTNITNEKALKGKHLWEQLINQYIELTENCRFNNAELSSFAKLLYYARTAKQLYR
jgi:hypothetical protein